LLKFPDPTFKPDALFNMDRQAIVVSLSSVCFEFGEQLTLCYQKTYKEFWATRDGQGSYSREMRPDFVLEFSVRNENTERDRQKILIVLDTKYRVETALNLAPSRSRVPHP